MKALLQPWWRFSRGLTLGARAIVSGADGVLLVRHSYVQGWYLPGGGVERGESVLDALARELFEEGNIILEAPPRLHGIFSNEKKFSGDHVVLFIAESWRQDSAPKPGLEIREARFFRLDALPEGTAPGTRRRLAEVFDGVAQDAHW